MAEAQSYFSPDDPSDELFVLPEDYVKDPVFVPGDGCDAEDVQAQTQAQAAAPEPGSGAKQGGSSSSG
ncbi:MAG: hypothetical protein FD177_2674 [Desulfovibrionaceae bacterium]|nr:MAG: hypothetical protein FD177_2674 [Desulfovibrionaceae bacterium]